jgi:hypothetical protein
LIRETRLKYAAELLQDSNLNISEVAYKSGFHSISYFSRSYKDYFGYPPKEHRNKQRISDTSTGNTGKRFKNRILQVHFKIAWIIALFLIPSIVISIIFINRDRKGRIPANNMETNKHFLKGKEYLDAHIYSIDDDEKDRNLDSSIRNLEIAIQLDSTFADAYSYLGSVYIFNYLSTFLIYITLRSGRIGTRPRTIWIQDLYYLKRHCILTRKTCVPCHQKQFTMN